MAHSTGGVIVKYVRHKVSVVRWRPASQGSLQEPDVFVTGSWDNGTNNKLSLWQFVQDDLSSGKYEIRLLCDAKVTFSITDIKFLRRTDDGLVLSCEDGSVILYRYDRQERLVLSQHWDLLHAINGRRSSCTSVTVSHDGSIVSSGEDNKICHLSVGSATPLRIIEDADVCGINAVTFSQLAEVLSVSSVGHLKVWDLRNTTNNKPAKTMKMSGDIEGLHCVQCHPTHPHLVVTGRSDGSVCFWDLRHHRQPLSHMVAHTDIVWDVHFHPSYPKHLFTCSNDGCLWHWDATKVTSTTTPRDSVITPWLTGDVLANGMDVINTIPHNVLPINSLDILSKHLITGADNEAIYVIPDVIDQ